VKLVRRLATLPLRFYRRFISPYKPPMCRFAPTCSQYAIEALELHGIFKGSALALWRIARCNPFCRGGYDPVPGSKRCHHDHPAPPAPRDKSFEHD
jgi:putative membrane protein insertion efficiency factor